MRLVGRHAARFETVTADNGTEFHDYKRIERRTGAAFYFARPYHSGERGSNENANGLIRQYLPKGASMAGLSQQQCNAIAQAQHEAPEAARLPDAARMLQRVLVSVALQS
jgi:IS30 family transposase